jgi:hypothetical protein
VRFSGRARGKALNTIAMAQFGIWRRGLLERLPLIGDLFFRRRMRVYLKMSSIAKRGTLAWLRWELSEAKAARLSPAETRARIEDALPIGVTYEQALADLDRADR